MVEEKEPAGAKEGCCRALGGGGGGQRLLSLLHRALRGVLLLLPSQQLPPSLPTSQVLGEAMAGISQSAKNSRLPEFGESISTASKALCGFTEAAAQVRRPEGSPPIAPEGGARWAPRLALPRPPSPPLPCSVFCSQAAYLVGVSDPNSQAGQQGLVDPTQFARANQAIQMACQNLTDPACTQSQVTGSPSTGCARSLVSPGPASCCCSAWSPGEGDWSCGWAVGLRGRGRRVPQKARWERGGNLCGGAQVGDARCLPRSCPLPPSWPSTPPPCATPAAWPPRAPPTPWPSASLSSLPRRWPTALLILSRPSR